MARSLLAVATVLAFCASHGAARAEPVEQRVTLPLFGKTVSYRIPAGFTAQKPQFARGQFLVEYLREGESFEDWTTLLTVRGFQGFGGLPRTSVDLARAIFEPKSCPGGPIFETAPPEQAPAGMELTYLAIGCAETPADAYAQAQPGSGEVDLIALYRDGENLYSVQLAVRGPSFKGGTPPLALSDAKARLGKVFGPVTFVAPPASSASAPR